MPVHYHSKKVQKFVSGKIKKIKKEGVRGKKVPKKQAVAIALSMARKKGFKVGAAITRGRKT